MKCNEPLRFRYIYLILFCMTFSACEPNPPSLSEGDMRPNQEDMRPNQEDMRPNQEDMRPNQEDMRPNQEDMRPNQEDMRLNQEDMLSERVDMMDMIACVEGYYDDDQDPHTPCVALWAPPTVDIILSDHAWIGENYTFSVQIRSESPHPLHVEWIQITGTEQHFDQSIERLHIRTLSGQHREQLSFQITVTDHLDQSVQTQVSLTILDRISYAVEEGDPRFLPENEHSILQRILDEIEIIESNHQSILDHIFGTDPIDYNPSRHSQFFTPIGLNSSTPLLVGNHQLLLAAIKEKGDFRGAAFGTNIFTKVERNEINDFTRPLKNLLRWLVHEIPSHLSTDFQQVKLIGLSTQSVQLTTQFIQNHLMEWSVDECNLNATIEPCLADAHLIIVGTKDIPDTTALITALASSMTEGTSLLYIHEHSWNSTPSTEPLLNLLGLSMQSPGGPGNYFSQDQAQWMNSDLMLQQASRLSQLRVMIEHFKEDTFTVDLSLCEGRCDQQEPFLNEFALGARLIRQQNQALEKRGQQLFQNLGETLHKLLVLLGDQWRTRVTFPMDKSSTPVSTFLKAYYADHSYLTHRRINPTSHNLGDFSRVDFSHITPITITQNYLSKRDFRSAYVYALPGQTFTVERLDHQADLQVAIQVNSLRHSSVHEFDENGYTRPKFITSEAIPITVGQELTITSPYGGPIQLRFDRNDIETELRFNGVGQHPVWKSTEDDVTFPQALERGDYDWAEVITPHFEIHSTLSKMRETYESPLFNTGSELAELITTYHHGYALALAGYQGPSIINIDEITQFVNEKGWPQPGRDLVQHFNADKPTCGYGCSGNPYDAAWAFLPLGHGDLHEVGHNHEIGRFKFDGREGHATTNFYAYFPKQQHYIDSGLEPDCQNLPFRDLFDRLQGAQSRPNPFQSMQQDQSLNGWSQGVTIMIQALMAAERLGSVERGWHLIGRLHAHDRAFRAAQNDDEQWLALRGSLGFTDYTRQEASSMSNNDYLFAALSVCAELNFQDYFTMWGLDISPSLEWNIISRGFPRVPQVFYAASPELACGLWTAREITIDGESLWIDLSQYERTTLTLDQPYLSSSYRSEDSSVYFLTLDPNIGPHSRVWWGTDGELTELHVPVINTVSQQESHLVIDAYQQRCDMLMTMNAGRVGGCDHRLSLQVDSRKNNHLDSASAYSSPELRPLVIQAWRWHEPVELIDTLVFDLNYTTP